MAESNDTTNLSVSSTSEDRCGKGRNIRQAGCSCTAEHEDRDILSPQIFSKTLILSDIHCSHVYVVGLSGDQPPARQYSATVLDSESEKPTADGRNTDNLTDIDGPNNPIPVIRGAVCIFFKAARRIRH
jgi:hypothetical protein